MPGTNQRFDLQNRVVVITGGGKGIGKVYAREFARAGARVVAADIDGDAATAVAADIAAEGGEALGLATDIADAAAVDGFARAALDRFGGVDVIANATARSSARPTSTSIERGGCGRFF